MLEAKVRSGNQYENLNGTKFPLTEEQKRIFESTISLNFLKEVEKLATEVFAETRLMLSILMKKLPNMLDNLIKIIEESKISEFLLRAFGKPVIKEEHENSKYGAEDVISAYKVLVENATEDNEDSNQGIIEARLVVEEGVDEIIKQASKDQNNEIVKEDEKIENAKKSKTSLGEINSKNQVDIVKRTDEAVVVYSSNEENAKSRKKKKTSSFSSVFKNIVKEKLEKRKAFETLKSRSKKIRINSSLSASASA